MQPTTTKERNAPALRIHQPGDSPPPQSIDPWAVSDVAENYTLDRYFHEVIEPAKKLAGISPATFDDYRRSLRRWEAFTNAFPMHRSLPNTHSSDRITNPVLAAITARALSAFQQWMLAGGHSNRATNKTIGDIVGWLSHAEKAGDLRSAPKVNQLPERKAATIYTITREEFKRVYQAAEIATWPEYVLRDRRRYPLPYKPANGWRCLLLLLVTYGMRTGEAVAYKSSNKPLTTDNIRPPGKSPHPAGKIDCPNGWIVYTPAKQSRRKPEPLVLPLTAQAAAHIRKLGTAPAGQPLFDWPKTTGSIKTGQPGLHWQFDQIFQAAGVTATSLDGAPIGYQIKHLRKTASTWLNTHRPGSAAFITGHAADRSPDAAVPLIQRRHYTNAEEIVYDALMTLPILDD